MRITRGGQEGRLDKPARPVKSGDQLVFALGGRLTAVRVEALGERRGPPAEARNLYSVLSDTTESAQGRDESGHMDPHH